MAFDDDDDNSSKFVILRKDNADITGQIRRMNNSFHDYNEVSYCFGMFRRIKKTQKEFIDRGGDDDIQDNQFLYNSQNQNEVDLTPPYFHFFVTDPLRNLSLDLSIYQEIVH